MKRNERVPEIDALKSVAIVTVVLIHSLRAAWDPGFTYLERLLSETARFAVPAFLAASGFLYHSDDPLGMPVLRRRLRRILLPYFFVSIAAYFYLQVYPHFAPPGAFLTRLLLADTFGPFYYVFLLTEFVLASYFLSRMPRRWTVPVFAITCVAAVAPFLWFAEGVKLSRWTLRLPLLFSCWFMLGWTAATYEHRVRELTLSSRSTILTTCAATIAIWFFLDVTGALPPRLSRASSLFLIGANIVGLFTVFRSLKLDRPSLIALSERTYAIYLLHLFFVYTVFAWFGPARHTETASCTVAAWFCGMAGSLLVIGVVRRLLPRTSRDLIGY